MLADSGGKHILTTYLGTSTSLCLDLLIGDLEPAITDITVYDDILANLYGAERALARGSEGWTIGLDSGGIPTATYNSSIIYTFTGAISPANVYGYAVYTYDSPRILVFTELAPASFTPINNGDQYIINLKIQLSKGTPT